MTQDEIIEMAIEAEFVSHGKPSDEESELFVCVDKDIYKFAKLVAAKAIAELESQEPVAWMRPSEEGYDSAFRDHRTVTSCTEGNWVGWTPLYTHPPQRTEPPDWFPAVENILKEYGLQAMDFVADFKEAMKDAEQSQRTWAGLTPDELNMIGDSMKTWNSFSITDVYFAIEAKLKEKNCVG